MIASTPLLAPRQYSRAPALPTTAILSCTQVGWALLDLHAGAQTVPLSHGSISLTFTPTAHQPTAAALLSEPADKAMSSVAGLRVCRPSLICMGSLAPAAMAAVALALVILVAALVVARGRRGAAAPALPALF